VFLCSARSEDGISDYHPASSRVMRLHCMVRPLPRSGSLQFLKADYVLIKLTDRLMDWLFDVGAAAAEAGLSAGPDRRH
jgi:hypothetical protein